MDQLDDIYVPELSIWHNLLELGWLASLVFIVCIILAFYWYSKGSLQRRQRKMFMHYLDGHTLDAQQVNAVLKAYTSTLPLPKQVNVASLHGKRWRAFLLANCDMQGYMQQLDFLATNYYKKEQADVNESLSSLAKHWIRKHKRRIIVPTNGV